MPGWERYGQQVLDVVGEEGCRLDAVVLGHMNPSGSDLDYQESLIARGAYLGFDMIGMDYFYADQTAQSPHDELVSEWVARLIRRGNAARLLLSSDVYLKMMLVAYGGNGYAHTITRFLPRLARLGIDDGVLKSIMTSNSRTLFEAAAESGE